MQHTVHLKKLGDFFLDKEMEFGAFWTAIKSFAQWLEHNHVKKRVEFLNFPALFSKMFFGPIQEHDQN